MLFVCCGGGGLLSGSALSARALAPACRVVGVEPDAGDDGVRSFATRTLQRVQHPQTIADGARTPSLGRYTFPLILRDVNRMMSVSDDALLDAMRLLWERMKVVVEPTGALGAAALLSGRKPGRRHAGRGRAQRRQRRHGPLVWPRPSHRYLPGRRVMTTTSWPPRAVGATVTPTNW